MLLTDLLAFSLVLFNVVSPLVSASIKKSPNNEKVLEEHLSELFVGLEEDPIINEVTVVEVNPSLVPEDVVDLVIDNQKEEDGACHPKDLSCSGRVTLLDTVTGEEIIDDVIDIQSEIKPESETVPSIPVDRSDSLKEPIMEPLPKMAPKEKLNTDASIEEPKIKEEDSGNPQDEKKPSKNSPPLISLLQGGVEEGSGSKDNEDIIEHSHEKVVHLNNHAKSVKNKPVVPSLKDRSDDILIPIDHSHEEADKNNQEHGHGLLGSVFNFFG